MASQIQQANIQEVLRLAVVKGSIEQAIDEFDDPLSDEEKNFLRSISPTELDSLRSLEIRLKSVHQSTKGVWAGAIW